MSEQTDLAEANIVVGGGVAVEAEDGAFVFAPYGPEDAADDREREDLEKSVREKIARFVELEGQLAAKQAAIARLERFHRHGDVALALEAMIVRVARGDGGDAAPDAKRRRREK